MRAGSVLVALLAFAVPLAVLGATGLNVEAQRKILQRLDDSGTRVITIASTTGTGSIPASAVDRIARLDGVAWVVGLGPVFDVSNAQVGSATPMRRYRAVRAPVTFTGPAGTSGHDAAFVSATSAKRLGLGGAYSVVEPGGLAVVGWFSARAPLTSLEAFVLVPDDSPGLQLERIIISVTDVGWVDAVAASVDAMVGEDAAAATHVERSSALLDARAAVNDEISRRDRVLVLALLAAAMLLACVVVFAATVAGRRDFGRRRALGATQGQLALLVMLSTLWPSLLGGVLGAVAGWLYLGSQLGHLADWQFPASVGILAVTALVLASALPAGIAATRDPLRVLRVP